MITTKMYQSICNHAMLE